MTKISQLPSIGDSLAIGDQFLIRDIDDAGNPNKSVTVSGITRALDLGIAAAPAIAFASDKNTGIYSPGADQLAASTAGTERLRITSAGLVGIGTSSPAGILDLMTGTNRGYFDDAAGSLFRLNAVNAANSAYAPLTINGSVLTFQTGATERARIDTSGRLLVGTSAAVTTVISAGLQVQSSGASAYASIGRWDSNAASPGLILNKSRGSSVGTRGVVQSGDILGEISFMGDDGASFIAGAQILSIVDGTPGTNDMPGRLVFFTTADGASSPTERLRITSAGVLQVADAGNIQVGTTTGTKIGTATTQKLGFYNATPVVQPAAVANATTAVDVITQLNDLLAKLRTLGIIAT